MIRQLYKNGRPAKEPQVKGLVPLCDAAGALRRKSYLGR